jgi:hypothetical protein
MINYNYILSTWSNSFGFGWDIFGTADYPFEPLSPGWIPIIQKMVLLTGLYFGISRGHLALKDPLPDSTLRAKAMILPSLFALLVINVMLKLFGIRL